MFIYFLKVWFLNFTVLFFAHGLGVVAGVEEGNCLCTHTPLCFPQEYTRECECTSYSLVFLLMFWCVSQQLCRVRERFGVFLRGCAVYVRDDLFRRDNLTARRPLLGFPDGDTSEKACPKSCAAV